MKKTDKTRFAIVRTVYSSTARREVSELVQVFETLSESDVSQVVDDAKQTWDGKLDLYRFASKLR